VIGGILSGPAIREAHARGEITIDPFHPERVNPASYDVTLGSTALVYERQDLDTRLDNPTRQFELKEGGILVMPGVIYLMHTAETVFARSLVACLDGKSSLGRLGLVVHATAGYIDPGFCGQVTLEVAVLGGPVRVYSGMRIGQLRFHTLVGEIEQYAGNYTNEAARGPVASKSWKQFGGSVG
jgi:dCTP deaminase